MAKKAKGIEQMGADAGAAEEVNGETRKMLGLGGNAARSVVMDGKVLRVMRRQDRLFRKRWFAAKGDMTAWRVVMACYLSQVRQTFPDNTRRGSIIGWEPYVKAHVGMTAETALPYVRMGGWIRAHWPDFHRKCTAWAREVLAGSSPAQKHVAEAVAMVAEWVGAEGGPGVDGERPDTFSRYVQKAMDWRKAERERKAAEEKARQKGMDGALRKTGVKGGGAAQVGETPEDGAGAAPAGDPPKPKPKGNGKEKALGADAAGGLDLGAPPDPDPEPDPKPAADAEEAKPAEQPKHMVWVKVEPAYGSGMVMRGERSSEIERALRAAAQELLSGGVFAEGPSLHLNVQVWVQHAG